MIEVLMIRTWKRRHTHTEKSRDFAEWALFALRDGGTTWPADVDERSALSGARS